MGMLFVVVTGISLLLVCAIRKKTEWLMNVVMRSVLGTIAIYFVNLALDSVGISLGVGVNVVTIAISGILGFPGLVVLYCIGIYRLL